MIFCYTFLCSATDLHTLTPLVDEQWWWLSVSWLDPGREQSPLGSLIPQILVQVRISDLLKWLNVIHWDQVTEEEYHMIII